MLGLLIFILSSFFFVFFFFFKIGLLCVMALAVLEVALDQISLDSQRSSACASKSWD